jgi:hypothetical protein
VRHREAVLPEDARHVGEQAAPVGDAQLQPHALRRDRYMALDGRRWCFGLTHVR